MKVENRYKVEALLSKLDMIETFMRIVDGRSFTLSSISQIAVLPVDENSVLSKAILGCLQAEKESLVKEIEEL